MSVGSSGYDSWSRRKGRQSNENQLRSKSRSATRSQTNHPIYSVFRNPQGYTELNLTKQLLTVVPQEMSQFNRLEVLNLSHNALDDLPSSLARIRTLKFLLVANNLLTHLPETITNLTHLIMLDLTHNKLTSLPQNLGSLRVLQTLKLGQNQFETLPHDIGHMTILKDLDLHSNNLCYLPFTIQGLRKLKYLNLANNRFDQVPIPVCKLRSLKVLNCRGNNLQSLAPDFEALTNLRELNLSYNRFESVPTAIYSLSELRYLNLAGNQLKHVSHHLTCLQGLQVLHIQGNNITSFPDGFVQMQYLNIASNQLTTLSVVNSRRLKYLNLKKNNLESMPLGVYNISRLETLNLNSNKITSVSKDIVQLKKLKYLDLGDNVLSCFPTIIDKMKKLDYFNLLGNNISHQVKLKNKDDPEHTHFRKSKSAHKQKLSSSRLQTINHLSMIGSTPKHSQKSMFSESHDLDELLQNGFSRKLLDNNYGSVIIRRQSNDFSDDCSSLTLHNHFIRGNKSDAGHSAVTSKTEDDLFLILNQLETFLNQDFRDPSNLSLSGRSAWTVTSSIWDFNENRTSQNVMGIVLSRTESFSVTEAGGNFISAVEPNMSISIPQKSISGTLHASLKIIKVEKEMLSNLREDNTIIANLLSVGPIVFLKANKDTDFNHLVTMTIPSPKQTSHGHLILLTIREDNSCIPTSSGHRQRHGYITLNAWQLTGKVAVITQAKCKYKACKSMEMLLKVIEQSV
ncbi:leucine-rich repeat protein soc-2 homolog [Mytilus edulis]|uniref:leucine-rich repeat protein soc-2 homolog n=1 Tax=Mytilus edulis TaxID=6550 RepID=UPI0039EFD068